MTSKWKKNFPPLPREPGRKELGWENGRKSRTKLGGSRSSRFRRGGR